MKRLLLAISFILSISLLGQAQNNAAPAETNKSNSITAIDTLFKFEGTTPAPAQAPKSAGAVLTQVINKAQQYAFDLSEIKIELSDYLDTTDMSTQLPEINLIAVRIKARTERDSEYLNHRYLIGMENLVATVGDLNKSFQNRIQERVEILTDVGTKLNAIKSDSLFAMTLRDSTLIPEINHELKMLNNSLRTIDSIYLEQEILTAKFQARISENAVVFLSLKQYLNQNKKRLDRQYWTKEINYAWQPSTYSGDIIFSSVVKESMEFNIALMKAYLERTGYIFLICVVILILFYLKIKSTINEISKQKDFASLILDRIKYFKKHTFISTLLILVPVFLIVFNKPPLVFISILSLMMVIASSLLVKEQFGDYFKKIWFVFLTPYILLALSSLNWKVAYQERWFILLSTILFIIMGILLLKYANSSENKRHKFVKYLAIFLIAIETFAFLTNVMGRFNLSKTYAVTGAVLFYRGIGLFLFVNVFLEAIYLFIENSKKETDGFTTYFDFQDLQKRMKGLLYAFAISIWVYGVLWQLGYFDDVYKWFYDFLIQDRTLGETVFQFGSILLFITILYVSTFLANNIAYFASVKDQKTAISRKQRLGSSVLIIRLAVLTIGFFIGMTAAKIPFDKIAIVLGALSVGIGFGLQTIINNLVSGVILAFERPIQIGDEIQVGENSGTVKEVGIRASKIQAYDGSEIVVPNGDLLSQSLINWTLSDKKRRVELIIGVGYGSDMKTVKSVLEEVLSQERILKAPSPKVYMQTFNDSSVDFRVLFWVESMDIWVDVRAEVMSTIFEKFAEHEIEIPFPKRDLYLKSIPSNWQEKISRPGEDISPKQLDVGSKEPTGIHKKSSEE
ncbi:mechanosensitive ion channel-like protein [Algoriphagus ratkowskyi]|uniref:Mechanosensitive ion channel n=1 Tax=Algoriphagus ratkowskyi TaxID=57028 RepID=A0A2W7RDY7_9BACT|nr:mechanosensitive ion channel domain-containing protein [Algoriphagus ratkowskyi]PZX59163.1 mechanosensitive ion channel-like protein [Algoriphagus ratkowskyi]TXD77554.1 mechanosensitive ion channel [Algoriphagus ratkowskyi]